MTNKPLYIFFLFILLNIPIVKSQSAFDSSVKRVTLMVESDKNNIGPEKVEGLSKLYSPELGIDFSYGRGFRIGFGLHYFSRPALFQDNGPIIPGVPRKYVVKIQAFDFPVSFGLTLYKHNNISINLNASLAYGKSIWSKYVDNASILMEAKMGIATDIKLNQNQFLEITASMIRWGLSDERLLTGGSAALSLRWGGLFNTNTSLKPKKEVPILKPDLPVDSTPIRVSILAEGEKASPNFNVIGGVPRWITPEFGIDASYGRLVRLGIGIHYFCRPAVAVGTNGNNDYVVNIPAITMPVSLNFTLLTYKIVTLNLNSSLAFGRGTLNEYNSLITDAKIGLGIGVKLPNNQFLEITASTYRWWVDGNAYYAGASRSLSLRWGGMFKSHKKKKTDKNN